MHTAQNTADLVHVPLPGYQVLSDPESRLSDAQLSDIAGGEIIITIATIATIGFTVASVGTVIGVTASRG